MEGDGKRKGTGEGEGDDGVGEVAEELLEGAGDVVDRVLDQEHDYFIKLSLLLKDSKKERDKSFHYD